MYFNIELAKELRDIYYPQKNYYCLVVRILCDVFYRCMNNTIVGAGCIEGRDSDKVANYIKQIAEWDMFWTFTPKLDFQIELIQDGEFEPFIQNWDKYKDHFFLLHVDNPARMEEDMKIFQSKKTNANKLGVEDYIIYKFLVNENKLKGKSRRSLNELTEILGFNNKTYLSRLLKKRNIQWKQKRGKRLVK